MSLTFSIADARKNISEIIGRVKYGKEHVTLTRKGKKCAIIISIEEYERLKTLDTALPTERTTKQPKK